jgi:hypothetical protein
MTTNSNGSLTPYQSWQLDSPGIIGPSHYLFPTGVAGVLYFPGSLHSDATRRELFHRLCPTNDDIWFKAMALLNRTPAKKIRYRSLTLRHVPGTQRVALVRGNVRGGANDAQCRRVFDYYGLDKYLRDCEAVLASTLAR